MKKIDENEIIQDRGFKRLYQEFIIRESLKSIIDMVLFSITFFMVLLTVYNIKTFFTTFFEMKTNARTKYCFEMLWEIFVQVI
jgi:fumarate reductase subunit C